ncbi:hypothetical protein Baya_15432 [Bagarius yarrelli]|uniref:BED-type domain-containing protein n=1 Tax=Bagarius yarrelli TaxID=175774 RepID=A0A556VBN6_BAGYA|nr:hypothetical protein Baya_15432 [Bagarius yarrelli]
MKRGPEKEIFSQSFPPTEREEEEEVMKEEEEEKSVSGDPFVVVKLEDEKYGQEAERIEQPSGSGSALDISLFAPIDSSEDAEEERPRKRQVRSEVWKYFRYNRDRSSSCKICGWKPTARSSGSTSNMRHHLQSQHQIMCSSTNNAIAPAETEQTLDLSEVTDLHPLPPEELKPNSEDKHDQTSKETADPGPLPDLCPPRDTLEPVWEHFGYPKDADGVLQVDGKPTCKICRFKVSCPEENTKFLYKHLWKNHNAVYFDVKLQAAGSEEVLPDLASSVLSAPDGQNSKLWEYFEFLSNEDGTPIEDGAPACKICGMMVVLEGDSMTNMMKHLQENHEEVHAEVQPADDKQIHKSIELCPPNDQQIDIRLWDHFGYPKNSDGEIEEDGAPVCKICLQKLAVSSREGNVITSMLRHLQKNHQPVYEEVQEAIGAWKPTADLHPPSTLGDPTLWEHYGYRRNSDGVVEEDGAPFCKLCLRKLVSRGDMTKNMKQHLKENHNTVYTETECAVTSETFEDVSTDLHPPSGQYNPKLWEHFGYRKAEEGNLVEDGAPICKLCLRKLISKGETTANMMQHLKQNHNAVYTEVQDRSIRSSTGEQPSRPVECEVERRLASTPCAERSPTAAMEPPGFHPALNMEGTRVGEAQQNVLLEVLNYCRFLHAAVQRVEQKIDSLQPNFRYPGISEKVLLQLTVPVGGAQLSRSLAQRLGPSPQTKPLGNPVWPQDLGNLPPHGVGGKRNKYRRRRARRAVQEEELGDQAAQKKSKAKRRRKKRKNRTAATSYPEEAPSGGAEEER